MIYGLFIGVNRYESEEIRPLEYAAADVCGVCTVMHARSDLAPERTLMLADTVEGATRPIRREILRAMHRFSAAPMSGTDTFVLMYAGHGFSCAGRMFLAAADTEPGSEALLRETAVSLDAVRDFLNEIKVRQEIVILDACRESPRLGIRGATAEGMSEAMTRDIAAVIGAPTGGRDNRRAQAILSSCWEGQVAYEYPGGGHGWFCFNLLQELQTIPPGELSLADLHTRLRRRMEENAWRVLPQAKDQVPHIVIEGESPRLSISSVVVDYAATAVVRSDSPFQPPVSATAAPDVPSASVEADSTPAQEHLRQAEVALIEGRFEAVTTYLRTQSLTTPEAELLQVIASLARNPLRQLHNDVAERACRTLAQLGTPATSRWRPLCSVLLRTLAESYYRPLARRVPPEARRVLEAFNESHTLDDRSRRLAAVIRETSSFIT